MAARLCSAHLLLCPLVEGFALAKDDGGGGTEVMFSESCRSAWVTPRWHRGHDVRVTGIFGKYRGRGVVG